MRTAKNILLHEFIGLNCKVVVSKNKNQMGINGKIIDETMKTIVIKTDKSRKRIQKSGSVFRLQLDKQIVDIDGSHIESRPEDRIKRKLKKW